MTKLWTCLSTLFMTCPVDAWAQDLQLPPPPPAIQRPAPKSATTLQASLYAKAKICEIEKRAHGLPVQIDPAVRARAVAAMGEAEVALLLRPVARTNYAHRCYCGDVETRAKLGCAN